MAPHLTQVEQVKYGTLEGAEARYHEMKERGISPSVWTHRPVDALTSNAAAAILGGGGGISERC
jgi:pentatricopeptide repeat protein